MPNRTVAVKSDSYLTLLKTESNTRSTDDLMLSSATSPLLGLSRKSPVSTTRCHCLRKAAVLGCSSIRHLSFSGSMLIAGGVQQPPATHTLPHRNMCAISHKNQALRHRVIAYGRGEEETCASSLPRILFGIGCPAEDSNWSIESERSAICNCPALRHVISFAVGHKLLHTKSACSSALYTRRSPGRVACRIEHPALGVNGESCPPRE